MSKQDEIEGYERAKRGFKLLADILSRAAQNADALDLKPEAKAWLLDQFGPDKSRTDQPVTDETLEYARDIARQQSSLERRAEPTSGGDRHGERIQGRRKSRSDGGDRSLQ